MAQMIVTVTLIGLLLNEVRWANLRSLATNLHWGFIVLSIILILISHLVNVVRWHYLLRHPAAGYGTLLALYGAGLFSNNFLPTGIGGDGVRAALLSRWVPLSQSILSVALDRMIGLMALSALLGLGVCFGLPLGLGFWDNRAVVALEDQWDAQLLVTGAGLLCLLVWKWFPALHSRMLKVSARWVGFRKALPQTSGHWCYLLSGGYSLSIVSHLGIVAAHWAVIRALAIEISPSAAIWLVLLGSVSSLLPISVNGLGLQEGIYVSLLMRYGVPTPAALGVALLIRVQMVFFSLLGGLLSLKRAPLKLGEQSL